MAPMLLGFPLLAVLMMAACYRQASARAWIFAVLSVVNIGVTLFAEPQESYPSGGWDPPLGIELGVDALARLFLIVTAVVFLAAALYHLGQEKGRGLSGRFVYQLSFPLLLLSLNGIYITNDFFNFYVFFELLAISSYLLVAMGSHHPLEASWKYAVLSILASAMLLAGIALLYGQTGTLNMTDNHARLLPGAALWLAPFFLFALLLKGSLFPLHVWQPDAHAGATTPGSIILAGALINVGVYGLLRFWPLLFGDGFRTVIMGVGVSSMVFGAVAAVGTMDAKRMLGYSSTSQLGFVLLGIGWGTPASITAAIFYLGAHALAKSLLFAVTGILSERAHTTSLIGLMGAGGRKPFLNMVYLLGFLSLAGLPPTAGFIAKISLFTAGVAAAEWVWIAAAVVGTLMTLVYGMRGYQYLFWNVGDEKTKAASPGIGGVAALALLSGGVLFLFVAGKPLLAWAGAAAHATLPGSG